MEGQGYVSLPERAHKQGMIWSPGSYAAESRAQRMSHRERCSGAAHLLGVQNLEEWEKQGRQEGGDSQRDDFCAPVNSHDDDDVGTPNKLERQP